MVGHRLDDGAELAAELLTAAWDARARLAEGHLAWTAACRVTLVGHNRLDGVACRLGFDDLGRWRVAAGGDLDAAGRSELTKYLARLLQPTALRELPDLGSALTLERWGPLTLLGHREGTGRKRYLGLEGEAIASRGGEEWTTRNVDAGWLLDHLTFTNGASVTEFDWTWTEVDGAWFPARVELQGPEGGGALWPERLVLELDGWTAPGS